MVRGFGRGGGRLPPARGLYVPPRVGPPRGPQQRLRRDPAGGGGELLRRGGGGAPWFATTLPLDFSEALSKNCPVPPGPVRLLRQLRGRWGGSAAGGGAPPAARPGGPPSGPQPTEGKGGMAVMECRGTRPGNQRHTPPSSGTPFKGDPPPPQTLAPMGPSIAEKKCVKMLQNILPLFSGPKIVEFEVPKNRRKRSQADRRVLEGRGGGAAAPRPRHRGRAELRGLDRYRWVGRRRKAPGPPPRLRRPGLGPGCGSGTHLTEKVAA